MKRLLITLSVIIFGLVCYGQTLTDLPKYHNSNELWEKSYDNDVALKAATVLNDAELATIGDTLTAHNTRINSNLTSLDSLKGGAALIVDEITTAYVLFYNPTTDSVTYGDTTDLGAAGGGNVFKVDTPEDGQLGYWTGDGTIEGQDDIYDTMLKDSLGFNTDSSLLIDDAIADYYVALWGNDSNNGSWATPWLTWNKAWTTVTSGQRVYIRGGTYNLPFASGNGIFRTGVDGTKDNPVEIFAFPGETPILDCSTGDSTTLQYILYLDDAKYWHIKGLQVKNANRESTNNIQGITIDDCSNVIIENCRVSKNDGIGFKIDDGKNVTLLNCDADSCYDGPNGGENADGFVIVGDDRDSYVELIDCRSWSNSDDGFDTFGNDGTVDWDGCQSIDNGYGASGDGIGFKLGDTDSTRLESSQKILSNCLSVYNTNGFDQNGANQGMSLFNCIAYTNSNRGFNFATAYDSVVYIFNCIALDNVDGDGTNIATHVNETNNSWDGSVTDADFISVDTVGIAGARGVNGSLPDIDFLKLTNYSPLLNTGTEPTVHELVDLGYEEKYRSVIIYPSTSIEVLHKGVANMKYLDSNSGNYYIHDGSDWVQLNN